MLWIHPHNHVTDQFNQRLEPPPVARASIGDSRLNHYGVGMFLEAVNVADAMAAATKITLEILVEA